MLFYYWELYYCYLYILIFLYYNKYILQKNHDFTYSVGTGLFTLIKVDSQSSVSGILDRAGGGKAEKGPHCP